MPKLTQVFEDRLSEIAVYLDMLDLFEKGLQAGPIKIGSNGGTITPVQMNILYSSVYVQLYNLVEATVTHCVEAVCSAVACNRWQPADLLPSLRDEWVRYVAKTHTEMNVDNRFIEAKKLCQHLIDALPISEISIEKGKVGNWDDAAIDLFCKRFGWELRVSPEVQRGVKEPIKDDMGPMKLIKVLRNQLAHGKVSFAQCGEDRTVGELKLIADNIANYLREMVKRFESFIEANEFLVIEKRPSRLGSQIAG